MGGSRGLYGRSITSVLLTSRPLMNTPVFPLRAGSLKVLWQVPYHDTDSLPAVSKLWVFRKTLRFGSIEVRLGLVAHACPSSCGCCGDSSVEMLRVSLWDLTGVLLGILCSMLYGLPVGVRTESWVSMRMPEGLLGMEDLLDCEESLSLPQPPPNAFRHEKEMLLLRSWGLALQSEFRREESPFADLESLSRRVRKGHLQLLLKHLLGLLTLGPGKLPLLESLLTLQLPSEVLHLLEVCIGDRGVLTAIGLQTRDHVLTLLRHATFLHTNTCQMTHAL